MDRGSFPRGVHLSSDIGTSIIDHRSSKVPSIFEDRRRKHRTDNPTSHRHSDNSSPNIVRNGDPQLSSPKGASALALQSGSNPDSIRIDHVSLVCLYFSAGRDSILDWHIIVSVDVPGICTAGIGSVVEHNY